MTRTSLLSIGIAAAVATLAVGCAKQIPAPSLTPTVGDPLRASSPPAAPASRERAPEPRPISEGDLFNAADIATLQKELGDVHFDYDQAHLRSDARATLTRNADWLKKPYNQARIEIEGHCDERGTSEYNLALGERRARSAYDYLASLGIPSSRLSIISYGKERPQCTDELEDCWWRNRRAHFRIVAK